MYITNIEKAKLSAEAIRNIYRLRWQVELVFKTWKSTYNIDKTNKKKYERWMTHFYAKMLVMLIHWQIYHLVKQTKFKLKNKLLSISKSIKSLQLVSNKITALIRKGIAKFKETITQLIELIEKKHDLERRKGRKNQQEIIGISYCMSAD
jgi:IS4 transposase